MSQRIFRLPTRTLPSSSTNARSQWLCRRCLATEVAATSTFTPSSVPPLSIYRSNIKDPSKVAIPAYDPSLPSSLRDYSLTKRDFYLKKALPQKIPPQYLQHSQSTIIPPTEQAQRAKYARHKGLRGVVVRSGRMDKTVTVRIPRKEWNSRIKKYFDGHTQHLVHDPNNSLLTGDVISMHRLRCSTSVHHVVASIVAPFGKPISDRPLIPTPDDRLSAYKEQRFAKLHRRSLRREAAKGSPEAIRELRQMGLDPGKGTEAGKGETANLEKGVGSRRTPSKGAILGKKGQKLPVGVLPGGKEEVGKINERARKNKGKAMRMERQAEENMVEAKEKEEQLRKEGLVSQQ